jgi:hypothetical protein
VSWRGGRGTAVIAVDCVQRSDAWRQARCGRVTASRAGDLLARGRYGLPSVSRSRYRQQLIDEQITGRPTPESFMPTAAMQRGVALEPAARAAYAARTGQVVHTSGFLMHDELMAGCSLDGYVGAFEGVVELKAPQSVTHGTYLVTRRVPKAYRAQMTHLLWMTGAQWCDFVSFDDRLPEALQLVVIRFTRAVLDVEGYDQAVRAFLEEIRVTVGYLEFFQSAPLAVATDVLAQCTATVRRRARRTVAPMWARPAFEVGR